MQKASTVSPYRSTVALICRALLNESIHEGEMTPVRLIPGIIKRHRWCWFGASVWTAGIEASFGPVAATPSLPPSQVLQCFESIKIHPCFLLFFFFFNQRWVKGEIAASWIWQWHSGGDWHFWRNPNNTVGFFLRLFVWEWKAVIRMQSHKRLSTCFDT